MCRGLYSFAKKEELRSSAIPLGQVSHQHGSNAVADLLVPGGKAASRLSLGTGLPTFSNRSWKPVYPFKII